MSKKDNKKEENKIIRRKSNKSYGLFIDGVGLDRATRGFSKKVDFSKLVSTLCEGKSASIARYYSIVPNQDDSRQLAFIKAIEDAGIDVITVRLPPVGVARNVTIDPMLATDLTKFVFNTQSADEEKFAVVVCPGKDLEYTISTCSKSSGKINIANFGNIKKNERWSGINSWLDLSSSETIWR